MTSVIVFAEIFIIGFQVSVWFFLVLFLVYDVSWVGELLKAPASGWEPLIVVLLVSFFYALGVVFDRLADLVFDKWDRNLRKRVTPESMYTTQMKAELGDSYTHFENQFDYAKSRLRIARASSINFALYTVLVPTVILTRLGSLSSAEKWSFAILASVIGSAITAGAVLSWRKLCSTYLGLVHTAYRAYASSQMESIRNLFELNSFLSKQEDVEVEEWGKGDAKTVSDLWNEIERGESIVHKEPFYREVEVVRITIRREGDGFVLVEAEQEFHDGRKRSRNVRPSEKLRIGESYIEAAKRGLVQEFGLKERQISILEETHQQMQEIKSSLSYPGVPTLFKYHIVEVKVKGLSSSAFSTEERSEGDPIAEHHWVWKREDALST
jgi:hypothetical protein